MTWGWGFAAILNWDNSTSVPQYELALNGIYIYPNPTSGIFTIKSNSKTAASTICVYDVLGNCVLDKMSLKNNTHNLDLSNQHKGIYYLEIISDAERTVKKIVLQ